MYTKKIHKTDKFVKTTLTKQAENVKKFHAKHILLDMTKDRALQRTMFVEDEDDSWFIKVVTYKYKSGMIVDVETIIRPDLENRILHLTNLGYNKLTNN